MDVKSIFIAESSVVKYFTVFRYYSSPDPGSSLVLVVDAGVVLKADPLLPVVPLGDDVAPEVKEVKLGEEG